MIGKVLAGMTAATLAVSSPLHASTFSDTLSKCLVDKTTEQDKTLLVQWVFSAVSAGPAVKSMSSVTPAQRIAFGHVAGKLFNRLLSGDCRAEAVTQATISRLHRSIFE